MRHDPFGTRLRHGLIACVCGALLGARQRRRRERPAGRTRTRTPSSRAIIKNILGGLGVDVGRHGHRLPRALAAGDSADASICRRRTRPMPSARNPAWPREPTRKKTAVQAKPQIRTPRPTIRARARADAGGNAPRHQSARASASPIRRKSGSQEDADIGRPLRPNELGSSSIFNWRALIGSYANETAKFEGEPTRGQLTQPPPGYQTPSAQPALRRGERHRPAAGRSRTF